MNVPIGVLLWLMIYPMMLKVDFGAIGGIARRPKGLMVTLFVNWLVKPFSMALLAWVFMQHVFAAWIDPEMAKNYTAGLIILAAAPCTAMVFVWSYLTDGDPAYTLVQVAVNDLIMLVAFAPIVMFLCGVAHVVVPAKVLITSVVVFIVIPLAAGWLTRTLLLKSHGKEWFEKKFLPKFHPVMIGALLLTLVLIFAFQAENLTSRWLAVLLIAVPIIIQVYFNSGLTYLLMRWLRVEHNVAAPGALIGASNFFELAVAVAITLFGAEFRGGAGDGGRRAGGGAGDAFGVQRVQPDAWMVWRSVEGDRVSDGAKVWIRQKRATTNFPRNGSPDVSMV